MDSGRNNNVDQNPAFINPNQPPNMPYPPFRYTTEELRVLRQCNREGFYKRSLPLATVLSLGTYYAVKTGFWRGHPKYGPVPKVVLATAIGYVLGKFSYQPKCIEKLMQLPSSPIGEMLRQRRRQGGYQEMLTDHASIAWQSSDPMSEAPHDVDSYRPVYDGLDDFSRPTFETPIVEEDISPPLSPPQQRTASYEDLRMKNREEYERKKGKVLFKPPVAEDSSGLPQKTASDTPDTPPRPTTSWPNSKNKYGDVWEE